MAGSVGNVVNVVDLLKKHDPETVRFLLLSTHYRSPIEYSDERLEEVRRSLEGFYRFFERYQRDHEDSVLRASTSCRRSRAASEPAEAWREFLDEVGRLRESFLECMDDDFNTGGAVGVLYELLTRSTASPTRSSSKERAPTPVACDDFRSRACRAARTEPASSACSGSRPRRTKLGGDDKLVAGLMQLLIDVRNNLRAEAKKIAAKDDPVKKALFEQTDLIRKRLGELGVTLEDRPGGTGWRVG